MSSKQMVIELSDVQQNYLMEKHNVKSIDDALDIEKKAFESSISLNVTFNTLKESLPKLNQDDEDKLVDMLCKKFNLVKKDVKEK